MMDERGRGVFMLDRQRDPGLDPVDRLIARPVFVGRAPECTMPRPAVIQFTSPGTIFCRKPRLS